MWRTGKLIPDFAIVDFRCDNAVRSRRKVYVEESITRYPAELE